VPGCTYCSWAAIVHSPMQNNPFINLPMPFLEKLVELHPKR